MRISDWSSDVCSSDLAGDEDGDAAPAPGEPLPADEAQRNAESLTLIERLLARSGQSEALREELEGYRSDIAAGEFNDPDHQYLSPLYKRLSPLPRSPPSQCRPPGQPREEIGQTSWRDRGGQKV